MFTMPTLQGDNPNKKREEIKEYFTHCYKRYELLFETIKDEKAYFQKAEPLRHPLIFYFGHTATFFINKLKIAKINDNRINPQLESIFAIGVDEMSWDDLDEKNYDWPTLEETKNYRDRAFEVVINLIETLPLPLPITQESPWWVILMGIEHENIHLETSAVLIRQLPLKFVKNHNSFKIAPSNSPALKNELIEVEGGRVSLGKKENAKFYGWDNEYGTHYATVPSFKASKYLVSNFEFLEFVEDNGYSKDEFWSNEGNSWKEYTKALMPLFWRKEDKYRLRTLTDEIDLPLSWAVEVNYLEAEAFCNWKSKRENIEITLPTEDEYIRLRDYSGIKSFYKWTKEETNIANINLEGFSSTVAVDTYKQGNFYDIIGNVWQWTKTPIYPFDGFKVHPIYDDFTVPTFDGKHNLIKGGSWISCGNLATQKSRYAFRRHFYQFAGFRYIQSNYKEKIVTNSYTTDSIIAQYCHFSWGENRLGVENYPKKCANTILEYMQNKNRKKALDIGCAIGRSTFELAKGFDEVIGIDFSARFIQEAQKIKDEKLLRYVIPTEGELESFNEVSLKELNLEEESKKVEFWQGDACNLKPIFKGFDLIFAGNLIDRLYDPNKFLETLSNRINPKGVLVLTSPYTWLEEYTPKDKWIGGYKRDGENITTLDGLKEILQKEFKFIQSQDIPFVIQETARKHQHTIAQMTIWEKRD